MHLSQSTFYSFEDDKKFQTFHTINQLIIGNFLVRIIDDYF